MDELPSFWSQVVPAGQEVMLDFPFQSTLVVTNACLGEYAEDAGPVRLTASVKTLLDEEFGEEEDQKECGYEEQVVAVCVLRPGKVEQCKLDLVFNMLNSVNVKNEGDCDVHLAGFLVDMAEEWSIGEEEEEEEEAKE